MPEQQIQSTRWHARQAEEALLELDSTAAGLTHEQAAQLCSATVPTGSTKPSRPASGNACCGI